METHRKTSPGKARLGLGLLAIMGAAVMLSGCISNAGTPQLKNVSFGKVEIAQPVTASTSNGTQQLDEYGVFYSTDRSEVVAISQPATDGVQIFGAIIERTEVPHVRVRTATSVSQSEAGTPTVDVKRLLPGKTYYFRFYTIGHDTSDVQWRTSYRVVSFKTSDPTLKSLTKSRGSLSPKFAKTKYSYTNTISRYTSGSRITVVPSLAGSSVQMKVGSGSFGAARSKYVKVSRGKSKVLTVRVTAPDGIAKDYVVKVKRKK